MYFGVQIVLKSVLFLQKRHPHRCKVLAADIYIGNIALANSTVATVGATVALEAFQATVTITNCR